MEKLRAPLLLLATLAFGAAPFLTEPFRGYPPDAFPVVIDRPSIQPAGYAFAIWSVIYLWLFVHAVFGQWKRRDDPDWVVTGWPMTGSLAVGSLWLFIAPQAPVIATVSIIVMAGLALWAFVRADTFADRWTLAAPIAIYGGWLSAASAVSLGINMAGYGLLSDTAAALMMIAVVLVVAVTVQWRQPRMPVYGLTVVWALVGVAVANFGLNVPVFLAALGGVGIMLVALFLTLPKMRRF
jgi:hypothetical protein